MIFNHIMSTQDELLTSLVAHRKSVSELNKLIVDYESKIDKSDALSDSKEVVDLHENLNKARAELRDVLSSESKCVKMLNELVNPKSEIRPDIFSPNSFAKSDEMSRDFDRIDQDFEQQVKIGPPRLSNISSSPVCFHCGMWTSKNVSF